MGPGSPPLKNVGCEVVKPLGDLWTVGHLSGEMPDAGMCRSIMTIGFEPAYGRFIGTFVSEVMTHLWIYNGALDGLGKTLILDTEGPSFAEEGKMAKYQDIIEIVDLDHRLFRSQYLGANGQWVEFMRATYRRLDAE